jgi:hypothetical protein
MSVHGDEPHVSSEKKEIVLSLIFVKQDPNIRLDNKEQGRDRILKRDGTE